VKDLGTQAEGDLFELRNLAVGKTAPEIDGEDVDGVEGMLPKQGPPAGAHPGTATAMPMNRGLA
jgi:hypothetical protein